MVMEMSMGKAGCGRAFVLMGGPMSLTIRRCSGASADAGGGKPRRERERAMGDEKDEARPGE